MIHRPSLRASISAQMTRILRHAPAVSDSPKDALRRAEETRRLRELVAERSRAQLGERRCPGCGCSRSLRCLIEGDGFRGLCAPVGTVPGLGTCSACMTGARIAVIPLDEFRSQP